MKLGQFALLVVVIGSAYEARATILPSSSNNGIQCSKGPANWCENISNAKQCNAVRHCIQTVWEKQDVREDDDSICKICLDMVKQARDQLESNETQSDLKAVFEGSCRLILLKPVVKECIKMADDFIPELIEALASQMNPQVVCSVAGLCNNAKIDKMLKEPNAVSTTPIPLIPAPRPVPDNKNYKRRALSCEECGYVSSIISTKFQITHPQDLLDSVLNMCGHAGSFSDSCANIALTYFNTLYDYLSANVDANGICHLSGTCVAKYHQHPENVEIQNWSSVGVLPSKDDIPCELCQQLVHHLQEVLTANTTELEFKQVLEGLCKQTKGFKAECLSIADQYYDQVYHMLVSNLDANGACFLIGVCPKGSVGSFLGQKDITPLIPYFEPAKINSKITKLDSSALPVYTKEQINSMQLPIDQLIAQKIPTAAVSGNAELCTLCEYFLHFLQETISTPATEDEIKDAVNHLCDKFPTSLRGNCHNFVEMYGDAVIALMVQGFDPRQMCPKLDLCPKNSNVEVAVTINKQKDESDKPTCPLCLFAVQQAQELIRDNKSKKNIKTVLDNLCSHLTAKLKIECDDFVETYSNELVDMLITDFTPQQVCVYINLCTSDKNALDWTNIEIDNNEELINDIFSKEESSHDSEIEEEKFSPECILCERVITEAEKKLGPAKTKEAIEKELYSACSKLKKLADKCHEYIDKYGDKIAALILQEMTPKQICKELGYCSWKQINTDEVHDLISMESKTYEITKPSNKVNIVVDAPPCMLCQIIIKKLEDQLKNKTTEDEIKQEVEHICKLMPKSLAGRCDQFIEKYGDLIIALVQTVPPKEICQQLELCPKTKAEPEVHANAKALPPCMLCKLIMKVFEEDINDKATEEQIKEGIEQICKIMPDSIESDCNQFIDKYGEVIINSLQTSSPKEVCELIMLCSAPSKNIKLQKINDQVVECGVCHGATSRLTKYINENEAKQYKSQTMIETVCNDLPAKYYNKCSQLLQVYGISIRNMIKRNTEQSKICAKIGKCFGEENSSLSYVSIL